MGVEGGYANDVNPESEKIYSDALIEPGIEEVRVRAPWPNGTSEPKSLATVRFQALRVGYFVRLFSIYFELTALTNECRHLIPTQRRINWS